MVGEDEKGREMAGQCKSKVGWGFLVGLVRECTTGFSGWLPGANGQNCPRPGEPRLYCIKAGFKAGHGGSGSGYAATRTI